MSWAWIWGPMVVAAAQLDEWSVGQFMWSRPIVLGPLLGWMLGSLLVGALSGIVMELLGHERPPVGEAVVPSAAVSVGAAVLLGTLGGVEPGLAVPAGLTAGWMHLHLIEVPLRRRRAHVARRLEADLAEGRQAGFGAAAAREIFTQFAATGGLVAAFLAAGAPALAALWRWAPAAARGPAEEAVYLSILAGSGMLAHALRPRG